MNIPVKIYFVLKFMAYKTKIHKLEYKWKEIAQLSVQGLLYAIESKIANPLEGPSMYANNVLFSLHANVCFAANI